MWIITRAINSYDQDGDYFYAVYKDKPNRKQLRTLFFGNDYNPTIVDRVIRNSREKFISHLLVGGGRTKEMEYEWYYLTEMQEGIEYNSHNSLH